MVISPMDLPVRIGVMPRQKSNIFHKMSFFLRPMPLLTSFIKHMISAGNDASLLFLYLLSIAGLKPQEVYHEG
jgi:hypothetical protein